MGTLTPRAEKILASAQSEASELEHGYVGTEHLLLALLAEVDGLAAQVLREFLDTEVIRARLLEIMSSPEYATGSTRVVDEHGRELGHFVLDDEGCPQLRT